MKKYLPSAAILVLFETVAVVLWLTKDNLFYLLNFSYIGICLAAGLTLFTAGKRYARHVVQLAVGLYMLVYLGILSRENMQIEGFWYYLFSGTFEAATIHYAVAKIFGPLLFGRGWCGYACWTAMVLDFLPYKAGGASIRDVCTVVCVGRSVVLQQSVPSGTDHVLAVPFGKCDVLWGRNPSGVSV